MRPTMSSATTNTPMITLPKRNLNDQMKEEVESTRRWARELGDEDIRQRIWFESISGPIWAAELRRREVLYKQSARKQARELQLILEKRAAGLVPKEHRVWITFKHEYLDHTQPMMTSAFLKTTYSLTEENDTMATGVSKCSPSDTPSKSMGRWIALKSLEEIITKKLQRQWLEKNNKKDGTSPMGWAFVNGAMAGHQTPYGDWIIDKEDPL